jgi:hypothetical protein
MGEVIMKRMVDVQSRDWELMISCFTTTRPKDLETLWTLTHVLGEGGLHGYANSVASDDFIVFTQSSVFSWPKLLISQARASTFVMQNHLSFLCFHSLFIIYQSQLRVMPYKTINP